MIDIEKLKIKTERMEIRPLEEADFPSFRTYVANRSEAEAKVLLLKTLNDRDTVGLFIDSELAGAILFYQQKEYSVHLGYSIRKDYRNRGLMTEALKAVTAGLFFLQGIREIMVEVAEDNLPSRSAVSKAGFRESGRKDDKIIFRLKDEEPVYIVAGDEMLKIMKETYPEREAIPFREDLSRGAWEGHQFSDSFVNARARCFGVSPEDYRKNMKPIMDLDFRRQYVLCFGEDACCRANRDFMISYLKDNGYAFPIRVMIVDELTLAVIRKYIV
ncbi:MAG: GNAT family N-acetyltransferase [Erysipelotrichaceae bacterium]|nr:GNAT family N-acetyltransferase [Erysipelotrichaceae bacterium]